MGGRIGNKNHRSLYNIGYFGIGEYKSKCNGKISKAYNTWSGMLERCYDKKYQEQKPTYIGCSVDERWHNFQVFAEWFYKNKYDLEERQSWHLDKDILIKGNKSYSPETCCLVPQEINTLFVSNNMNRGLLPIGVTKAKNRFVAQANIGDGNKTIGYFITIEEAFQAYKTAKEVYIKEVADEWKHLIDDRVYQALYNYKVEITD